jgi:hypothetical protein
MAQTVERSQRPVCLRVGAAAPRAGLYERAGAIVRWGMALVGREAPPSRRGRSYARSAWALIQLSLSGFGSVWVPARRL